ncbi:hypothetical protein IHE44_0014068 [Lamprotornis superbus]|uniref:ETS domain-containing protein n=1 Tax=Lamprotornis superbus TaxID=245042 RepID=A0A835NRJ2_9PASS|nr:hypothetical protein IHE44_0014068 [Lamprotornis superbus]
MAYSSDAKKSQDHTPKSHTKKHNPRGTHLWEFIRDILLNPEKNPGLIKWEDRSEGVFRFLKSEAVAQLWGKKKNNSSMTYEKLSRAMRYYYKREILERVDGRRLVYKFGKNARGNRDETKRQQKYQYEGIVFNVYVWKQIQVRYFTIATVNLSLETIQGGPCSLEGKEQCGLNGPAYRRNATSISPGFGGGPKLLLEDPGETVLILQDVQDEVRAVLLLHGFFTSSPVGVRRKVTSKAGNLKERWEKLASPTAQHLRVKKPNTHMQRNINAGGISHGKGPPLVSRALGLDFCMLKFGMAKDFSQKKAVTTWNPGCLWSAKRLLHTDIRKLEG